MKNNLRNLKSEIRNINPDILICLFLVIATLAVYWQVRNHEFVAYDDGLYVTENPYVRAGLTSESILWAFTATHANNWHPLTWLSHMLDVELYGMNPGQHLMTNVLFHIANTLLLFLTLSRMTGQGIPLTPSLWQSAFVAALFALHPLHVESVAWVAERKDVLSTFFWMLTMLSYAWYVERPGIDRYLPVFLFFMLGLMAKPMLVTLPFVLFLLDCWPLNRFHKDSGIWEFRNSKINFSVPQFLSSSVFLEKIPLLILTAASSVVTYLAQQSVAASLEVCPFHIRIANALVSYISYIGKMICPVHLALLYPHPRTFPGWQVAGAFFLLALITFLIIRNIRQRPWLAVGWLWYLGTLVPVIGLVQVGLQGMADRYTYIPLIGLFIMIAWGIPELLSPIRIRGWRYKKKWGAVFAVILILILMAATRMQVRYWKDSVTLFEHSLDVTTDNGAVHCVLGTLFLSRGNPGKAVEHYSEGLRLGPDHALLVHNNLGVALFQKGRVDEAIFHFKKALQIKSDYANALDNLKKAYAVQPLQRD